MNLKNWSERLIWATILISVVRYAAAFAASDVGEITGVWSNVLTFLLSITGVGMGFLDTAGGGLLFNGWSRVFPKHGQRWSVRFVVLTACVFGLLASGLIILVPFSMSRLSHESVLTTLGGKNSIGAWVWAGMVNLIPYLLIAGVFVGNKMVIALEDERTDNERTMTTQRAQRTNSERTTNAVSERIEKFVTDVYNKEQRVPGATEIANTLGVSKSYASEVVKYITDKNQGGSS